MVSLALLEQSIETIEQQHERAIARVNAARAAEQISRHEASAQIARLERTMQERISRLIKQVK